MDIDRGNADMPARLRRAAVDSNGRAEVPLGLVVAISIQPNHAADVRIRIPTLTSRPGPRRAWSVRPDRNPGTTRRILLVRGFLMRSMGDVRLRFLAVALRLTKGRPGECDRKRHQRQ